MTAAVHAKLIRLLSIGLLALYDLAAVVGATIIALVLRFDYLRAEYLYAHRLSAPLVFATYLACFYTFRLYRYRWSFASVEAVWSIFLANILASALSTFWQVLIDGVHMPRSITIMTCIFTTALVGGQRIVLRSFSRYRARERNTEPRPRWQEEPKRTIILGAEHSASEVLSALATERAGRYEVIGILDPDPRHHGTYLRGIRILGGWEMMHDLVQRHAVDEVIIAWLNDYNTEMREYVLACCQQKVAVRMVPVTAEWLENPSASRRQMRVENIRAEDLLHRPATQVAPTDMEAYLTGKRVLVTGAGGSIGAELCRQISQFNPAQLILLGHGENSIHHIRLELQRAFPAMHTATDAVIADIRDAARIAYTFERFRPQIVFHAAAHKHVPLMEENIAEAVNNNVAGSRNLIRAATAHGVERMVLISTDKAVNPSSVMGATKFLCEELARAEGERSDTCFIAVRFGNVLGSRGSVLPRFQEQILYGGPVTITHPEMRRYFMTIPEAVSLVLRAGFSGQTGELFVLDMGRPVRIVSLAEDLIRLSGLVPYRDIAIEFSGLRPGEKLSEELFTDSEMRQAATVERAFVVHRPRYIDQDILDAEIDALLAVASAHQDQETRAKLEALIPTFRAPVSTP